jgi:subtilisin
MPEGAMEVEVRKAVSYSPVIAQQFQATGLAQVIVVLKRPAAASAAVEKARKDEAVDALRRHFTTSELTQESAILESLAGPKTRYLDAALGERRTARPSLPRVRVYPNLSVMLGNVTKEGLTALHEESDVASVTGAPIMTLIQPRVSTPAKLTSQIGWGVGALEAPRLWKEGITGEGVVIAHLDTGVDGTHPALQNAISSFAEFDQLGEEVKPAPEPHDSGQHGTHTAATVVGRAVRGLTMGMAPAAKLASAMVIEGGNVVARVLAGLDWALGKQAKVLSMSLGLPGWVDDFLPVIQILRTRGVLPVIAVGNEGPGTSRSPGNYAESLSVGAADKGIEVASFSSSQRFARPDDPNVPDIVGPGVDIISAVPGRKYATMSGTSMATPHIAGLAALLFQAQPSATINDVETAILRSCELAPGMSADRAGHGFPNAVRALEALTGHKLTSVAKASGISPHKRIARSQKKAVIQKPSKTKRKKMPRKTKARA